MSTHHRGSSLSENIHAAELMYLQAELARIDVKIRRQVRLWQLAGQDPYDTFRGLYISDAEVESLMARPWGSNWGQHAVLPPEELQAFDLAEAHAARQCQLIGEQFRSAGKTPALFHLVSAFNLDSFELDAFLICLAPMLDLRYGRLYAYLQDDVTRKRPTVNLILDLLCEPTPQRLLNLRYFSNQSTLIAYGLLERVSESGASLVPLLEQVLIPDESVVAWLLGRYEPSASLSPYVTFSYPQISQTDEVLTRPIVSKLSEIKHLIGSLQPIIAFYGQDVAGQLAAANLCAAWLKRPLLNVDLLRAIENGQPVDLVVQRALRDARLTNALPFFSGWDALMYGERVLARTLLSKVYAYSDSVILAGQNVWQSVSGERRRPLFWLEFSMPDYTQRSALWAHFLHPIVVAPATLETLSSQFILNSEQICDAVASAKDMAAQEQRSLQPDDLVVAARMHSSPQLASLARKIEPHYSWADIVLPDDQLALLREIVNTVRGRALVLDKWGVGKKLIPNSGVMVLFAGPPGTGKTMAAEVIAAELGLDLFKIDLSTVVSKYIGETEKNLERIFSEAQSSNAILFFDEADALFGKRSEVRDAHDRYANIEISYLLQRMELYDGVTILATNLRANLDEAFTRRLQFSVDFPFPEEEYRLRIWQTLFPPDVPRSPDVDLGLLARRFKLAGGNIRNIIVNAAYLAAVDGQVVTMQHLLHGARRELQKIGRLVNEKNMLIE